MIYLCCISSWDLYPFVTPKEIKFVPPSSALSLSFLQKVFSSTNIFRHTDRVNTFMALKRRALVRLCF
ncbi:hypothetical protein BCR41DRAFT_357564 [Lobosporangium transversale]|uniref:Uncharacterized protein n=1 Tax=Lobosporangium transversale TaxID=64571 RepID=A0A1Y2GH47_9FUNG|nr:hypothetical protein BCR41DRAFT_357564 [Lobosporangium transversale]ORZ10659.1 hypothetical protein BCR41DRAFT_357564 [Lobosporangium transversale]|eukprot:XP_021879380.1 hypothetical protein BCR41DRAFT_357564 [Lobosporangium transversale]